MLLNDPVYGLFDVREPVLVELIHSPPMQRLKGVSQGGILEEVKSNRMRFSRYDHSIGVMLLLRKLGASVEEQIAGLVHDSSHTAFSHVADWVFGNPAKGDYQDAMLEQYIKSTALGEIIIRNGFNVDHISSMESSTKYGLLERPTPDLCADRLDYTLRDGALTLAVNVKRLADALVVRDNEILFNSKHSARGFADLYVRCQATIWMANENMFRYHLLAEALKCAIDKGFLTHGQMYGTDNDVVKILRESGDSRVLNALALAGGPLKFTVSESGGTVLKGKIRYVDPKFVEGGNILRLSKADPEYSSILQKERDRMSRPVHVKLVD